MTISACGAVAIAMFIGWHMLMRIERLEQKVRDFEAGHGLPIRQG